jgi:hypothetical protein
MEKIKMDGKTIPLKCSKGHIDYDPKEWGKPCTFCLLERIEDLERKVQELELKAMPWAN